MELIFRIEMLLKRRIHGYSMFLMFAYECIKNIFMFLTFFIWGILLCLFIKLGYITQFTYEQLIIVIILICNLFLKKENQYAIIPYQVRIKEKEIKKYLLAKELISPYNFLLLPLVIPIFFLNKIEWSTSIVLFLVVNSFFIGFFINLFIKIIKFFCEKRKLYYIITMTVMSAYTIALIIIHNWNIELSYLGLVYSYYTAIVLFISIILIIPLYIYTIKQEIYLHYESSGIKHKSIRLLESVSFSNNIYYKLFFMQLIRCKGTRKLVRSILFFTIAGLLLYFFTDFKLLGLSVYLGAYTLNMVQYTLYLNSNYYDGISIKPVSINTLLLCTFNIHICISSILFVLLFIHIAIYDNTLILSFFAIYLYVSGPMALILFFNILFIQKHDVHFVDLDFVIQRTFSQKIIGLIAGGSLFGVLATIHFFPRIGCYIVIATSIISIMTHHYWIRNLYLQFMNRKYKIMDNLRNK